MGCISSKAVSENVPITTNKATTSLSNKEAGHGKSGSFSKIDNHAKRAPSALKNSVVELVAYMKQSSTDHKLLVRGFFVWISENIMYDLHGLRSGNIGATDTHSVMKAGHSVCEGYANVMKDLCEEAGIPVKKISGFSKGAGYDPATPFTVSSRTDHAWNAVKLDDKWHLLDSTWGTGHVNGSDYVKEFEEFYFLTKAEEFINDHFPYMDSNMEESKKWQLLKNPITLDEFSRSVLRKPHAFALGMTPKSHMEGHIIMNNEVAIQLQTTRKEQLFIAATLMHDEGRFLREQRNGTFSTTENGRYTLYVHPNVQGKYTVDICADVAKDNKGSVPQVMSYSLQCTSVKEADFEYPYKFGSKLADQCKIVKPMNARLPSNSMVTFEVVAPTLEGLSVNQENLKKSGSTFTGTIKTGSSGLAYTLSSAVTQGYQTSFEGLFRYHTV